MKKNRDEFTVSAAWREFVTLVVPRDAPPEQLQEMRRAFYGGFWAALCTFQRISGPEISEQGGVEILQNQIRECERFKRDVLAGKA